MVEDCNICEKILKYEWQLFVLCRNKLRIHIKIKSLDIPQTGIPAMADMRVPQLNIEKHWRTLENVEGYWRILETIEEDWKRLRTCKNTEEYWKYWRILKI